MKDLIKVAHKAPFGKGSETITDTNVRSAWEIDADQLSFHNPDWKKFMNKVTKKVQKGLGIKNKTVDISLYKLLIYEEGDFFLPHKDSEKEPGMFATLVVALPSEHTGGELVIRFGRSEETVDFSQPASNYKMSFAAFYADCEHEIKPVTSGYRVCLVYNVLQKTGDDITSPVFGGQAAEMSLLLKSWIGKSDDLPKAVLLGHEYTPANFSLANLKLHDRPRAEALIAAANSAGFFARLGLVTEYKMGQLEDYDDYDSYYGRRRRGRYYQESSGDPTDGSMGEIYEHYVRIEHWAADDNPGLGGVGIDHDDILTDIEIGTGEPTQKEAEGYTGNAGMTMEYWYHYGAVILWPKDKHADMLLQRPLNVQLDWLKFYADNWSDSTLNSETYAMQIVKGIGNMPEEEENTYSYRRRSYDSQDYTGLAAALIQMNNKKIIKENEKTLIRVFKNIKEQAWCDLILAYEENLFNKTFREVGNQENIDTLYHLLKVLAALIKKETKPSDFVMNQLKELPLYFNRNQLHNLQDSYRYGEETRENKLKNIIYNTLQFSQYKNGDADWVKKTAKNLTKSMPRDYVNKVLHPVLIQQKNTGELFQALYKICQKDYQKRTAKEPQPPENWTREVPNVKDYDKRVWEMLSDFLQSPTQQVFDYAKRQSDRSVVERAIKYTEIDLKTETIRKGSPHTLRITKTQAAYKKKHKQWKKDVELMKQLEDAKVGLK